MKFRLARPGTLILCSALLLCLQAPPASAQRHRSSSSRTQARTVNYKSSTPARFASGRSALNVPFDLVGNLILVQAAVNNSTPLWFILDTGASHTVLDTEQAKALGLKARGNIAGTGTAGTFTASRVRGVSVSFPGVELTGQTVYTAPVGFLSAPLGRHLGGIIGNDIIGRFALEIDYANRKLNFYDPASYQYSGMGQVIPLTITGNGSVFASAEVEIFGHVPLKGKFEIDTGSTDAVQFNAPYVKKHRLLGYFMRPKQVNLGGMGGTAGAFAARVRAVRLGTFTLYGPIAQFSQATKGDAASAKHDGLLGGQIFSRFKMIVDLSRRRMIVEPNARLNAQFEEDISGLELHGDGENFSTYLVNDVEAGSPAADAGIREEDVLVAIDGRAASEYTLDEIRRMFMHNQREYMLTLKRGGETVQVKLKLKAQSILDPKF